MSTHTPSRTIVYPESDGLPMAENTLQFEWIAKLVGGLEAVFRDNPNIFVAGDLLWYPVEGTTRPASLPTRWSQSADLKAIAAPTCSGVRGGLLRKSSSKSVRPATGSAR